jgi:hypothetical protein
VQDGANVDTSLRRQDEWALPHSANVHYIRKFFNKSSGFTNMVEVRILACSWHCSKASPDAFILFILRHLLIAFIFISI